MLALVLVHQDFFVAGAGQEEFVRFLGEVFGVVVDSAVVVHRHVL